MYHLKITDSFSAAHQLKGYRGKCEKLHGHNFKVEIIVKGEKLDKTGLLIDFKKLKKILNQTLETLDHQLLNQIPEFKKNNPSSENIAKYIFNKISPKLPENVTLYQVSVFESDTASASYIKTPLKHK